MFPRASPSNFASGTAPHTDLGTLYQDESPCPPSPPWALHLPCTRLQGFLRFGFKKPFPAFSSTARCFVLTLSSEIYFLKQQLCWDITHLPRNPPFPTCAAGWAALCRAGDHLTPERGCQATWSPPTFPQGIGQLFQHFLKVRALVSPRAPQTASRPSRGWSRTLPAPHEPPVPVTPVRVPLACPHSHRGQRPTGSWKGSEYGKREGTRQ